MAKKREATITDAVEYFNYVIERCKFTGLEYMDGIIFGKRKNFSSYVIIIPEKELIPYVIPEHYEFTNNERIKSLFPFIFDINNDNWIKLNDDEVASGFNIKIDLDGFNYQTEINKKIIPLRLLKKEFNNFYYQIKYGSVPLFFMKKIFENVIPNTNFTLMQIYHIL